MNDRDKKIHIAFFLPNLEGGGAEHGTVRLMNGLDRARFRPSLMVMKKKGPLLKELSQDVSVRSLHMPRLTVWKGIRDSIRDVSPDIFVSALTHMNILSLMAKFLSPSRTKFVITQRTTLSQAAPYARTLTGRILLRFVFPSLVKFFYPRADAIVCVSKSVAADVAHTTGTNSRLHVIYNPVVSDHLLGLAKESVEHPWFQNKTIPLILAVGRLAKPKDYATLLRAFCIVLKKQAAHLVIIGEGDKRKNIEVLIRDLGIGEYVDLLGFQENPYKYMARATLFVLSSRLEGFPNVLVEAMSCGVPVVCTDCPSGPNEIIENGKSGFLVPVQDEDALASAILRLLDDTALREKMSEEGKIRSQRFTVREGVAQYEKLFFDLCVEL